MLKLMYITNDPKVARIAVNAGVERIFLDMEVMGKAQRQGHMDSVKFFHTFDDIRRVRQEIGSDGELMARLNPPYDGTGGEVEQAIASGADCLMLPMWKSAEEVTRFVNNVAGRAKTVALLETREADGEADRVCKIPGLNEVHIGLNDLHLSYGRSFLFELLADGTVDRLCATMKQGGKPYGFGGVGRPGGGMLPAERILAEHYRLGSSMVILSRSFCDTSRIRDYGEITSIFQEGVGEIRRLEASFAQWTEEDFLENHREVGRCVEKILQERGR